jgi:hypothetical protein
MAETSARSEASVMLADCPVPVRVDNWARLRLIVKTALLHRRETECIERRSERAIAEAVPLLRLALDVEHERDGVLVACLHQMMLAQVQRLLRVEIGARKQLPEIGGFHFGAGVVHYALYDAGKLDLHAPWEGEPVAGFEQPGDSPFARLAVDADD